MCRTKKLILILVALAVIAVVFLGRRMPVDRSAA